MADWRGEDVSAADRYRRMARYGYGDVSPSYRDLAYAVADDAEVLGLIERLPVPQQQPNLVFGAARWLDAPIASWAQFRPWLVEHWPQVEELARNRRTQTNEALRLTGWLPALPPGPIALIEVGASAGLCLFPDRWRVEYRPGGTVGPDGAPVLTCPTEGDVPVPSAAPQIVWRRGLDLHPLDVRSDADVSWLRALIWPEQTERLERLDAAVQVARADPPLIVEGDLLTDLDPLLDQAPAGATPVVVHTAVLAYLTEPDRERFTAAMQTRIAERGLVWISNEAPGVVPGTDIDVGPGSFVVARNGTPIATSGQHGAGLRWLGAPVGAGESSGG